MSKPYTPKRYVPAIGFFGSTPIAEMMETQDIGGYVRFEDLRAMDIQLHVLRMNRISDLNCIGGLQEEVAFLKGLLERLDEAVYFHNCKPDSAKCSKRIDAIIVEFQKRYHDDNG